jgi:hemolysin III
MRPSVAHGELIADRCVHVLGIVAAALASPVLLAVALERGHARVVASVALYATTLIAMVTVSALYNFPRPHRRSERLRRIDHATIFLLIAGTYTPFALLELGAAGRALLAVVWTGALAGVALKILAPRRLERASIALYLILGWAVLFELGPLTVRVPAAAVALLLGGGVAYTVGVGVHLAERVPYRDALWHALVVIGAACHYAAVLAILV